MLKSLQSAKDLLEGVPELQEKIPEGAPAWPTLVWAGENGQKPFSQELSEATGAPVVGTLGAGRLENYLRGLPHAGVVEDAIGRCLCGRSVRLLRQCWRFDRSCFCSGVRCFVT